MNKSLWVLAIFLLLSSCMPKENNPAQVEIVPPAPTKEEQPLPQVVWTPYENYQTGFAWFYKPPEQSLWPLLPVYYDFFILTHRDEEARDTLRNMGINAPFYQYLLFTQIHDPGDCEKRPRGNQVAYKAGDFCQISANHPDWFLTDMFGNRIKNEDNYYHMDPANPGYQVFWVERALEMQNRFEWDGLFIDNVEASLSKYLYKLSPPRQHLSDASLQAATSGFLEYIQVNLRAHNRPVFANIISIQDSQIWLDYLKYLDGAMLENFAVDWLDSHLSVREYESQINKLVKSQQMGKTIILVAQGEKTDLARQEFAYATYLLVNEGRAYFRYTNSKTYNEVWQYANYDIALGNPIGPAYQQGDEWIRLFEHGQVIANPGEKNAEIIMFESNP
jgi:hypothetical protein